MKRSTVRIITVSLVLCLLNVGCGQTKTEEKPLDSKALPTSESTPKPTPAPDPKPTEKQELKVVDSDIFGIWGFDSALKDGSKYSLAEIEKMGDDSLSDVYLVFKEGGSAYLSNKGNGSTTQWTVSEDGTLTIGDQELFYDADTKLITLESNGTLFLSRISKSQDITDIPELQSSETGNKLTSGFDKDTNTHTIIGGVDFQFPSYFDVRDDESVEDEYEQYYPLVEEYYASLIFKKEDLSKSGYSTDSILAVRESIANSFVKDRNADVVSSGEFEVAGFPGWQVVFNRDIEKKSGSAGVYTFFYIEDTRTAIHIILFVDNKDESNYDYFGDYDLMLDAVTVLDTKSNKGSGSASGIRPEFKAMMDEYEAFMDDYCDFMEEYLKADSSKMISMMSDYLSILDEYSDYVDKIDEIDTDDLSSEEYAYYTEVTLRVSQKLLATSSKLGH